MSFTDWIRIASLLLSVLVLVCLPLIASWLTLLVNTNVDKRAYSRREGERLENDVRELRSNVEKKLDLIFQELAAIRSQLDKHLGEHQND
jgi:hypothetical protein